MAPYFHDRLGLHAFAATRPFLKELAPCKLLKAHQLWQQVLMEEAKKSVTVAAAAATATAAVDVSGVASGAANTANHDASPAVITAVSAGGFPSCASLGASPTPSPFPNAAERFFSPPSQPNAVVSLEDSKLRPSTPAVASVKTATRAAPVACPGAASGHRAEGRAVEYAPSDGTLTEGSSSDGTLSDGGSGDDEVDDGRDENSSSSGNSEGWSSEVIHSAMWKPHGKCGAESFVASAELRF